MELLFAVFLWFVSALFCGSVAVANNRSGFAWFVLGFLFGPFALLALIAVPTKPSASERVSETTHARCPACREVVRRDATKCRHCGETLSPTPYAPRSFTDRRASTDTMRAG